MGMINVEGPKPGDRLVNLDEKVFPEHQANQPARVRAYFEPQHPY